MEKVTELLGGEKISGFDSTEKLVEELFAYADDADEDDNRSLAWLLYAAGNALIDLAGLEGSVTPRLKTGA